MVFSFLDLIFPKRCVSCGRLGVYICSDCFTKIEFVERPVCPVCQRQAVGGRTHPGCRNRYRLDGLVVACRYRGPVKRAIAQVKYKWVFDIEKVFVDLISESLWRFDLPRDAILVPVPLHVKRKRWRGFNQAEILAKSLAKSFTVPFTDVLVRVRETASQVGLRRDKRKENVRGAFALRLFRYPGVATTTIGSRDSIAEFTLNRKEILRSAQDDKGEGLQNDSLMTNDIRVKDKNILLIDDVYTSGATMGECCRVLKKAGAKEVWGLAVALG